MHGSTAALLLLLVPHALACLGRPKPGRPKPGNGGEGNGNSNADILRDLGLGEDDVAPVDNSAYESQSGPVGGPDELACDFEGDCCWGNERPPIDKMDYLVVQKEPNPSVWESFMGSDVTPQGNYLMALSANGDAGSEARFVSCTVDCSNGDITVILDHWQTRNAVLEVCSQTTFGNPDADPTLLDCVELPRSESPGPTQVDLPKQDDPVDIVIIARNLVGASGDVVAVDNINVDYAPCDSDDSYEYENPDEPTEAPGGPADCAGSCSFERGEACGYVDSSSVSSSVGNDLQAFEYVKGKYRNPVTGVRAGPTGDEDDGYAATYLHPDESAAMETEVNLQEDRILEFQLYEATYDMDGKLCLDTPDDCPYESDIYAQNSDRQWTVQRMRVPKGTKKIFIIAENVGTNQGAVAIDNLKWYRASSSGGDQPGEPICD